MLEKFKARQKVTLFVTLPSGLDLMEVKKMVEAKFGEVMRISSVGQATQIANQSRIRYQNPEDPTRPRGMRLEEGFATYEVMLLADVTEGMKDLIDAHQAKLDAIAKEAEEKTAKRQAEIAEAEALKAEEEAKRAEAEAEEAKEAAGMTDEEVEEAEEPEDKD